MGWDKTTRGQGSYLQLRGEKSLEQIISDGFFQSKVKCPQSPCKPRLKPGHSSREALEYASVLATYEHAHKLYKVELKEYRDDAARLHNIFKWACIQEITGMATDMRPKYLEAVEIAWAMAWDRGHSSGLHEVYQELLELNTLLTLF
jgi:hypothetical protein